MTIKRISMRGQPIRLHAMALDLPKVFDHPNKMPFSGILTRVGVPSDAAPHGSNGKRVLLTHEAAEAAIPSLLGMGVDLTADLDGHDPTRKIGLITGAHIEGDALKIEGFIYAADFPKEALRIHLDQADLGFSFEAQRLQVESLDTDPLVVVDCVFTGAAILMKDAAAYRTTALAAAAARKHEMEEALKTALQEIVAGAVKPVTDAVGAVTDRLGNMERQVSTLHERVEANAATVSQVEPLASTIEKCAASCEAAGIGLDPSTGHAQHLRRIAGHMRSEAALGRLPAAYSGVGMHFSADPGQQQQRQPEPPRVEDSPAFKALEARLAAAAEDVEKARKADQDKIASLETMIADMKASASAAKPAPERKTLPPLVANVLAKAGIGLPEGDGKMTLAQIEPALAGLPNTQRIQIKLNLQKQGLLLDDGAAA